MKARALQLLRAVCLPANLHCSSTHIRRALSDCTGGLLECIWRLVRGLFNRDDTANGKGLANELDDAVLSAVLVLTHGADAAVEAFTSKVIEESVATLNALATGQDNLQIWSAFAALAVVGESVKATAAAGEAMPAGLQARQLAISEAALVATCTADFSAALPAAAVAVFTSLRWKAIRFIASIKALSSAELSAIQTACNRDLPTCSYIIAVPMLQTLRELISQLVQLGDSSALRATVATCWAVFEANLKRKRSESALLYEHVFKIMFAHAVQEKALEDTALASVLIEHFEALLTLADSRDGAANGAFAELVVFWTCSGGRSIGPFAAWFVKICALTSMGHHDTAGIRGTIAFLGSFLKASYPQQFRDCVAQDADKNTFARVTAIELCAALSTGVPGHQAFASVLIGELLAANTRFDKKHGLYHPNSSKHKFKMRIWCHAVLLGPLARPEDAEAWLKTALQALAADNMPTVRIMIEWFAVHMLSLAPGFQDVVFAMLLDWDQRPGVIVSLISILASCAKFQGADPQKVIQYVLPWTGCHLKPVRAHAQIVVELLSRRGETAVPAGSPLKLYFKFLRENEHNAKFADASSDDLFLHHFDPIRETCVEFIFHKVLLLFKMDASECITPQEVDVLLNGRLASANVAWHAPAEVQQQINDMTCIRTASEMNHHLMASKLQKLQEQGPAKAVLPADFSIDDFAEWAVDDVAEVQKKIVVGELSGDGGGAGEQSTSLDVLAAQRTELIVVASLIENPTNLGGLARTCEIFNAGSLVCLEPHARLRHAPFYVRMAFHRAARHRASRLVLSGLRRLKALLLNV